MTDDELFRMTRERVLALYPFQPVVGLPKEARQEGPGRDEILMMTSLFQKPFLTGNARAGLLKLSSTKTSHLLGGLEAKNWIQPLRFSRVGRGYVKYYDITEKGLAAAQLSMPDEGAGSCIHRQCQAYVRDLLKQDGHDAKIEFTLNGKRADVAFPDSSRLVAVEIGISSAENEASNITKDFSAGYAEVRALLRESAMIERVKELLAQRKGGRSKALRFELLTEYLELPIVPTESKSD